jgi:hypothetical protein
VLLDALQIESKEEEQSERAEVHHRRNAVCRRECWAAKQPERKHRCRRPQLSSDETEPGKYGKNEADDDSRADAAVTRLDDRKRQGGQRQRGQNGARYIEGLTQLIPVRLDSAGRNDAGDGHDGDIDREHPSPTQCLNQQSAEQGAGGEGNAADTSPDTDGSSLLGGIRVSAADDGQRAR